MIRYTTLIEKKSTWRASVFCRGPSYWVLLVGIIFMLPGVSLSVPKYGPEWRRSVERFEAECRELLMDHLSFINEKDKTKILDGLVLRSIVADHSPSPQEDRGKARLRWLLEVQTWAEESKTQSTDLLDRTQKLKEKAAAFAKDNVLGKIDPRQKRTPLQGRYRLFQECVGAMRTAKGPKDEKRVQRAVHALDEGLTVLADLDRWCMYLFGRIEEDCKLARKHEQVIRAGIAFMKPEFNAIRSDWPQIFNFYQKLWGGHALLTKEATLNSQPDVPNILPELQKGLVGVLEAVPKPRRRKLRDLFARAAISEYDCAYLNFALYEWSWCNGEKQLAGLIGKYLDWAESHQYSADRTLDGLLDIMTPGYTGSAWYWGRKTAPAVDRCDPRILPIASKLKGDTAGRTRQTRDLLLAMRRSGKLQPGPPKGRSLKHCLDVGKAGCGMMSAIYGAILSASGMDGVYPVALKGPGTAGHAMIAVQTPRGLLFADGSTGLLKSYPEFMKIKQRQANGDRTKGSGYATFIVFDRSFASNTRSLLIVWGEGRSKPLILDRRPPWYRCTRSGVPTRRPVTRSR